MNLTRWIAHLGSLRSTLALLGLLALAVAAGLWREALGTPALVIAMGLLSLNLAAALVVHPAFRRQLPLLVGADFELRLQVPGPDGELQLVDLTARCLWCIEDVSPQCYDSEFMLYQPPAQYLVLIDSLREYFSFLPLQASA